MLSHFEMQPIFYIKSLQPPKSERKGVAFHLTDKISSLQILTLEAGVSLVREYIIERVLDQTYLVQP